MKTRTKTLRKGTLLAAALLLLLLSPAPLRAQYVLDLSSIDYFTTSGDIPVSPAGSQAEVEFGFYNGGPQANILRSNVLQAVEDADCSDIITDVTVQYTYGTYEGVLTFTLAVNNEGYREIDVTASTGSVTIHLQRPAADRRDGKIKEFLNEELKATIPEKSPNYNAMPFSDSKKRLPKRNHTVLPSSPSGKTIVR